MALCNVVQQTSGTYSSCITNFILNSSSPCLLPLSYGNHHSTSCFCAFDYLDNRYNLLCSHLLVELNLLLLSESVYIAGPSWPHLPLTITVSMSVSTNAMF